MKRKIIIIFSILILGVVAVFLLGPRVEVDETLAAITLPEDLDDYLADTESAYDDIVPGAEKTIVWAGEPGVKTPLAVVYLHGFSATRQETAPLAENLAQELGVNLYHTRFAGHGRSNSAMAEASVNDWLHDTQEALEIGRRLGEEVIVLGVSTGATAATWLATQPDLDDVAAFVLISPNYAPRDSSSEILLLPWGEQIAKAIIGPERSWEPLNAEQARYWTYSYPTEALLPMMGLVDLVRDGDLEAVNRPVLVIYSPNDQVVSPQAIEETFARFGSPEKEIISVAESQDPSNHVLAGNILAPDDTATIAEIILSFLAAE
jgi:esterase/lipase